MENAANDDCGIIFNQQIWFTVKSPDKQLKPN